MPEYGDGLTIVSAMRHASPNAAAVIFSAYPEMKRAAEAVLKQTDVVVVKPLGIENLVTVIRERLQQGMVHPPHTCRITGNFAAQCAKPQDRPHVK